MPTRDEREQELRAMIPDRRSELLWIYKERMHIPSSETLACGLIAEVVIRRILEVEYAVAADEGYYRRAA
jgi:hypothetical protein